VHGPNNSHTTKQCKCKEAQGQRQAYQTAEAQSYNKSWSCKSEEAKKTSKEELGTLVKEQVEKQMSLYIAQQNKKHSSNSNDDEFHAIEDLSSFNYKNMADINNEVSV
jgi:hypothetical protein